MERIEFNTTVHVPFVCTCNMIRGTLDYEFNMNSNMGVRPSFEHNAVTHEQDEHTTDTVEYCLFLYVLHANHFPAKTLIDDTRHVLLMS